MSHIAMTAVDKYKLSVAPSFQSAVECLGIFLGAVTDLKSSTSDSWFIPIDLVESVKDILFQKAKSAYDGFKNAECVAKQQKSEVDRELEKLVSTETDYRNALAGLENNVRQCEARISCKETEIREAKRKIEDAEQRISSAKTVIETAENQKVEGAVTVLASALWLGALLVPVVGPVVGPFGALCQAAIGTIHLKQAQERLQEARNDKARGQSNLDERNNEVRGFKSELRGITSNLDSKKKEILNLDTKIRQLKTRQSDIGAVMVNLGNCVHFLSATVGKTSVLRDEAQDAYSLEPIMNTINDIGLHLQQVSSRLDFRHNTTTDSVLKQIQFLSEKIAVGQSEERQDSHFY